MNGEIEFWVEVPVRIRYSHTKVDGWVGHGCNYPTHAEIFDILQAKKTDIENAIKEDIDEQSDL